MQQFISRLPDDLHESLRKYAFDTKDSMNSITVKALELYLKNPNIMSDLVYAHRMIHEIMAAGGMKVVDYEMSHGKDLTSRSRLVGVIDSMAKLAGAITEFLPFNEEDKVGRIPREAVDRVQKSSFPDRDFYDIHPECKI